MENFEGGNSGIMFNVHESAKWRGPFITGPEMQVFDNAVAPDMEPYYRAGALYGLIGVDSSVVHPAGRWNQVRIRLDHGCLTFWVNHQKVIRVKMWTTKWKRMIAHSKFKKWKVFGSLHKRKIALQGHNSKVWYRNIKIRKF